MTKNYCIEPKFEYNDENENGKKLALFYCLWMAMAHTNCFRTHYDRLPIRITIFRLNLQKWKEFARKQIMYLEFIFDKNRTIENYWIINVNQSSE